MNIVSKKHLCPKTHQYRKVMKPLLERKRRARINKCLDELKELMIEALQTQGEESITKLEKADILELTVRHLRKLKNQEVISKNSPSDRYIAGYTACASEVSQYLSSIPGINVHFGSELMSHLGNNLTKPLSVSTSSLNESSSSVSPSDLGYVSSGSITPPPEPKKSIKTENVWRPF
ncbi:HESN [Lepeophtheirus salmonis]|uniref:HESN n=1 Tax=Lepeophtheirus salmonis TaxID=72036 RepID=A0A7R8D5B2_LEPSM|nr:HESN [Lepeophtheirus salmonis]CAF3004431.1 HESN [Lepeophtheirus salmonis]